MIPKVYHMNSWIGITKNVIGPVGHVGPSPRSKSCPAKTRERESTRGVYSFIVRGFRSPPGKNDLLVPLNAFCMRLWLRISEDFNDKNNRYSNIIGKINLRNQPIVISLKILT